MATLQKLRNAGPLLVIFVGLALFAFIAGDAWRLIQSNITEYNVGSVNGEEVSVEEFQKLYHEYTNVVKFVRNTNNITEEEMDQLKDEVWNSYIANKVVADEAAKIGLTVTNAEIEAIVEDGTSPMLQQTPFRSAQGGFDKDILNNFLASYEENKEDPAFVEQYGPIYEYWCFIERALKETALANKYQALIQNSFIGNPIVAKSSFDANSNTYDVEVAAYPYAAISNDEVTVSESDLEKVYDNKKNAFKQPYETRDIKYVSFHITPQIADREKMRNELAEWADTLKASNKDYSSIARQAGSDIDYSEIAWTKAGFPEEVQARIDSVAANTVVGPFYNQSDDSYTVFKVVSSETSADSVMYRMLAVTAIDEEKTKATSDSLLGVLKAGADFKEVSKKYNQQGNDSIWFTSAQYNGAAITGDDATFANAIIKGKKGEYNVIKFEGSPSIFIYQVIDTKNPVKKYNAVVIKRKNEVSNETYSNAYNKFSQFVASCKNLAEMEKSAEEFGYRVMTQNGVSTATHRIANIAGTKEAHRWVFDAKENEISPLYECGNNDYLLVAALSNINEKGYTSLEMMRPMIEREAINEKKAEKIMSDIKGKNFDEIKNIDKVKTCETKRISFSAPAYISATASNEPAISAAVCKLNVGETSAPIKGTNGVYVIKLVAKTPKSGEFDSAAEESKIKLQGTRETYRFMNDLMDNAEIEDNRYLYIQ